MARSVPKSAADLQLFELKGEMTHLARPQDPGAPNHDGMACTQGVQNLIVNYWLKLSEISYAEISWISLGEQGGEGVMVRLHRGQTIRLGHLKEGTIEFYHLLKFVWEKAQEQPK